MSDSRTNSLALQQTSPPKRSLALRRDAAPVTMLEMCSVQVGSALYGIPIAHILEIVGGTETQSVPLAPEFVGGLFHYRGDVLTTVSLRSLLGMPRQEALQDILVLEGSGGCFGLLVDAVGEVLTVSSAHYEPNPSTLDPRFSQFFAGTYKLDDRLLVMLNPEPLDPMRLGEAAA